jgi:hypothetical protein
VVLSVLFVVILASVQCVIIEEFDKVQRDASSCGSAESSVTVFVVISHSVHIDIGSDNLIAKPMYITELFPMTISDGRIRYNRMGIH